MTVRMTGNRDTLLANVLCEAPDEWSVPEISAAMVGLMDLALNRGLAWGVDWTPIWPTTPDEWEQAREYGVMDRRPPRAAVPEPSPSAPLWDYLAELHRTSSAELPMPPNRYQVTRRSEGRILFIVPSHILSDGECVNLAVWLLALADPKLEAFGPMFAKVGNF